MATEVYTTEVVRLLDETEVELRPLPIAKLRKFMRIWNAHMRDVTQKVKENQDKEEEERNFTDDDLTDEQYTTFIKMSALGLESQLKEDKTEKQYLAYLEDVLDERTIYKILELTGGLKLGVSEDANLQNQRGPAEAGTN